jgi:hypothetical protein
VPQASKDAQAEKDALTKIDAHLHEKISALPMPGEGLNVGGHALKIEPYVVKLKFVDGGTRFFAGAFAGSSAVVMQLKLIDEATNEVVAQPEFFQRAAAMGGAWSIGGTGNGMPERIASVAAGELQPSATSSLYFRGLAQFLQARYGAAIIDLNNAHVAQPAEQRTMLFLHLARKHAGIVIALSATPFLFASVVTRYRTRSRDQRCELCI